MSRKKLFLDAGCLFLSTGMEPQLPSPHKVRGGWRGLTYIVVGPDLFELTGILLISGFYTNISLGLMDVVLNISCSLQMSAFSYLNTHFHSIVPVTALLTFSAEFVSMLSTNLSFFWTGTRPSRVWRCFCQGVSCYSSDQILPAAIPVHPVLRVSRSWRHGGAVTDARVSLESFFYCNLLTKQLTSYVCIG